MKYKCILYDFDGVMTDNKVLVSETGKEYVYVNRSDGLAISYFKKLGIKQYIVSTEKNPVVSHRGKKLGIEVYQGIDNKLETIQEIVKNNNFKPNEIIFIGNDLNDKQVMEFLSNTFCPKDSHPEILKIASKIIDCKGGKGVIMALYDYVQGGSFEQ